MQQIFTLYLKQNTIDPFFCNRISCNEFHLLLFFVYHYFKGFAVSQMKGDLRVNYAYTYVTIMAVFLV